MPPNPTGPTNLELRMLTRFLRKAGKEYNAPVWKYAAGLLERPTRRRVEVNLYKIERYAEEGDYVLVPGKVLGFGVLTKKVVVAAWRFSRAAREKIYAAGGEAITIAELVRRNNRGSKVKILV